MAQRIGHYTLQMASRPAIEGFASAVDKKGMQGSLSSFLDLSSEDTTPGESNWEKAESRLQTEAVNPALHKAGVTAQDIDYIFTSDPLNRCLPSTLGLHSFDTPFLGQFGVCSTTAQTPALVSVVVESGAACKVAVIISSHFYSAERQFRLPLEYGRQ